MKKIIITLLLLLSISTTYSQECTYTLRLSDTYGDGWYHPSGQANALLVLTVNEDYEILFCYCDTLTYEFTVDEGDEIYLDYYVFKHRFEDENSWSLFDCGGNIIFGGGGTGCDEVFTTIADCSCPGLPVSFITSNYECNTELYTWSTASETNNDYFTLTIGSEFINGFIIPEETYTLNGAGNANVVNNYTQQIELKNRYVSLSQTDYDGTTVVLSTNKFTCDTSPNQLTIFPNPSNGTVFINGVYGELFIHDITGKQIYPKTVGNQIIDLSSGTYVVSSDIGGEIKLIVK